MEKKIDIDAQFKVGVDFLTQILATDWYNGAVEGIGLALDGTAFFFKFEPEQGEISHRVLLAFAPEGLYEKFPLDRYENCYAPEEERSQSPEAPFLRHVFTPEEIGKPEVDELFEAVENFVPVLACIVGVVQIESIHLLSNEDVAES